MRTTMSLEPDPPTQSDLPDGRWVRYWTWLNELGNRTVLIKQTIVPILFVAGSFFLIFNALQNNANADRRRDLRTSEIAIYQTQVNAYNVAVANYQLCVSGITLSDANREQWRDQAEKAERRWAALAATLDVSPDAKQFIIGIGIAEAEDIRTGPLLTTKPRTTADCINPGEAPVPPSTLGD